MDVVIDIAGWLLFGTGGLALVVGSLGMLRLPDFWSRIHAAGMIDTVGAEFILAGMMLHAGWSIVTLKLLLIGFFIFIANPTSTHAIANAAWIAGVKPRDLVQDDSAIFTERNKI